MKQYNSYKPSGVEWIGDIPNYWIISKVSRYFFMERGRVISKEEISDNIGEYPVYSSQTENEGILGHINSFDFEGEYVSWTTDGANAGTCFYRIGKFNSTNVCGLLSNKTLNNGNNLKFLNYFLNLGTRKYVRLDINPKLMNNMMGEIPLVIPPLQEQEQIVKYLDEKTTIIDKLISTKERKIELLKEKRTSLINEVITKGLNPNVKMKDSGVEWIGEIPESWGVGKLKNVVESNKKVLQENTNPDYELKYIEIGDVNSSGEIKGMTDYMFKDSPSRCRRILSKGDIFISTVRTYLKSIGYVEDEISDVICSTGFCVLTPKTDILSKYLFYQVLTEFFIGEVISKSVGVSYPSITSTELINIKIIKPSIQEQQEIVEYLDIHTKEIDDLVSMEQKKIELLKEYRQSLISEVITGKIKVV